MNHKDLIEDLKKIILPILEEQSLEFVELKFLRAPGGPILKLLVDKKGGISLDDCAQLNEKINNLLDNQDIIEGRYILEVSSPGLDRPLKNKHDFLRCINRNVRFFLKESINGKLELVGIITKVEDDSVYIDAEDRILAIPISKINKAKQVIE